MKKNFLQDVVPASHRRSIRDIPLPKHRDSKPKVVEESIAPSRRANPEPEVAYQPQASAAPFENKEPVFNPQQLHTAGYPEEHERQPEPAHESYASHDFGNRRQSGGSKRKFFMAFVITAVVAGLFFMFGRTKAEVVITPKKDTYEVDVNVPVNASSSIATLTQITKTQSVTLEATSEQQVERQASGRIKITNLHEEESQDLVKNTRFQTPEGLVYRIKDSITIPGYKVVNGTTIPGTLEVEVYADSAGEEYNIGMTKFTIPGFSGMPQFEKITAESVTQMTGGFIGIKKVVSKDAEDDAYDELKDKLEAEFTSKAEISDTQVVVPDIETLSFGELIDEVNGNSVTLKLSATSKAYSFAKEDLMNHVGRAVIPGSTAENAFSFNPNVLSYTKDSDNVMITGSAEITWLTDLEAVKTAIAGKKRSEITSILGGYQSIGKATTDLKPFWKTKFPTDAAKISVEVTE